MKPYRGKTKEGNWVYGWYKEDTYGKPKILAENPEDYFLYWFFVLPETVGQSIGLKDKNGKEIYEGDRNSDAYVVWNNTDGAWNLRIIGTDQVYAPRSWKDFNIIGNIHDNPDLLKK